MNTFNFIKLYKPYRITGPETLFLNNINTISCILNLKINTFGVIFHPYSCKTALILSSHE
jgi:hypothetical protein